jgi:hypothetical protein
MGAATSKGVMGAEILKRDPSTPSVFAEKDFRKQSFYM